MLAPRYFLYLAVSANEEIKLNISSNLRIDASILGPHGFREFIVLQPPQPIWIAEKALQNLRKLPEHHLVSRFAKIVPGIVNEIYPQKHLKVIRLPVEELQIFGYELPPDIAQVLEGYCLLGSEIPEILKRNGYHPPWDCEDWLQYLVLQDELSREAAVSVDALGLATCRRCGATSGLVRDHCIFCGVNDCYTCTNCQTMGLAKSCVPFYKKSVSAAEETGEIAPVRPELQFSLTPPQKRAAERLESFIEADAGARTSGMRERQFLVWAVCGGGKTEVSFSGVASALSRGQRVLVAIPRKDVVQELLPRFQKAFPGIDSVALYGGSGERFADAPLVLATTHQCLRFYQRFDLIVLDEADAFPYQGSAMLRLAVARALKPEGKLVIMTATPDKALLSQVDKGRMPFVSIPARYHRKPLIVPEFAKGELPKVPSPKWEPPPQLGRFLSGIKEKKRKALLFFPTIHLIREVGPMLIRWAAAHHLAGECVFAGSANRDAAKTDLLGEKLDFLITSTILERGITIPNLDVAVLWADYEAVFDCPTLVQIAGRASRLGEPAVVVFISLKISRAMKECRQWIESMNREALELGFVDK